MNYKNFCIIFFIIALFISLGIAFTKPKMHKPFSLNIIEYVVKFKQNGQTETIRKETTFETKTISGEEKETNE